MAKKSLPVLTIKDDRRGAEQFVPISYVESSLRGLWLLVAGKAPDAEKECKRLLKELEEAK